MQYGLVKILNNQQLDEIERQAQQPVNDDPYAHLIGQLSSHIETCWQAARDARAETEQQMLRDLRQREGKYDPDKLQAIREQGGSEVFMQLTNLKCRALDSWLRDILFPPGERPFYCGPTDVPDLSPDAAQGIVSTVLTQAEMAMQSGVMVTAQEVYQASRHLADKVRQQMKTEAETKASRMEDEIDDVLLEGQWYEAMEDFIGDMSWAPFAVLKGPVVRKNRKLSWVQTEAGWQPQAEDELVPVWYSPSPFDIWWAADSTGPQDGYLFERIRIRHGALHRMIGVPGYKEEAIRAVLAEYASGYRLDTTPEQERRELEGQRHWEMTPDAALDMLEFHGQVRGEYLIEWGMEPERVPDPGEYYEVTAAKIGRYVIRCVLNEDPMRLRPYEVASFDRVKGQFAGSSLPSRIRDVQEVCNAAARALVNNLGIASGPMGEVEVDRLAEGEDATKLWPWRMIQTQSNRHGAPAPAVRWHNVSSHAQELLQVYTYFSQLADTYSGVQSFDHGVASRSGSASTASGLSMLMNASSRQMRRVVAAIDRVITGTVRRVHTHVMLYGTNQDVKGDVAIEARGASQMMVREQQQMRRAEFLAQTANPIDMSIIGPEGRAEMLREAVKNLDIPVDLVVPDRDEVLARVRQAAMQAIPQQGPPGAGPPGAGPPGAGPSLGGGPMPMQGRPPPAPPAPPAPPVA